MDSSESAKPTAKKSHVFRKILLAGFIAYLVLSILAGIAIADVSLKLPRLPLRHQQAFAVESRFCAVAVESPFSTAREMSFERVSGPLHMGPWFGRTLGRPAIWSAVVYARVRYGINLLQPNPLEAVAHSRVPVLLIHGEDDRSIAPRHSQLITAAASDHVALWLVPHAGHTMAWAAAPREFERRLLGWFATHWRTQDNISNAAALSSF